MTSAVPLGLLMPREVTLIQNLRDVSWAQVISAVSKEGLQEKFTDYHQHPALAYPAF